MTITVIDIWVIIWFLDWKYRTNNKSTGAIYFSLIEIVWCAEMKMELNEMLLGTGRVYIARDKSVCLRLKLLYLFIRCITHNIDWHRNAKGKTITTKYVNAMRKSLNNVWSMKADESEKVWLLSEHPQCLIPLLRSNKWVMA